MPGLEDLLGQMTLQEKVALLAGTNMWYTVPVERLGIPSLKTSDGPNGARGAGGFTGGVKSACFPAGISLASTWDTDLIERVGQALARETTLKGAQVLLGPTVNIQRSPLGGRNFECFSEDPYLSARLAVAYIKGLQGEGVGASIKHYVCNDEEFERFTLSSEVRERALREIYLQPFQTAVREVKPWTIMAAYNLVNGIPASENSYLLTEILRNEWGYDGVVVSDWFMSVKSTAASVNAGLDLEMPSPKWRGEKLLAAVQRGEVEETTIDTSVRRLLHLLVKAGLYRDRLQSLLDMSQLLAGEQGSEHGLAIEYFNSSDLSGTPIFKETKTTSEFMWFGEMPEGVDLQQFSLRATGRFTPLETGDYTFGLVSAGRGRFSIDGRVVIDNWSQPTTGGDFLGTPEVQETITLQAGREYLLMLEYAKSEESMLATVRLGYLPPLPADAIERASALAAASDVAIVCVGFGGEWQSEGFDREALAMPGKQDALIEQVAAANPRTIVVLNTGSPITMPWLDKVAAVVQAWYPGQECGNAIADVLFGDTTPSGKLPQTFPVRLEDNPAYLNFPGENGKVYYGEGLFVGYRYYDKKHIAPLFPFGFGLSYTTFSYSSLSLSAQEIGRDDMLQVSVDVTNTGERAGKEIVQLYIRDVVASLQRPEKELKAFAKVHLEPGERQTVTLNVARDALAYYDDLAHAWVAEAGEFEVLVGASSQDIRAIAPFVLTDSSSWL